VTASSSKRPSQSMKDAASIASRVFGGTRAVHEYLDQDERVSIPILECVGSPSPGWSNVSTVGLHRYPNHLDDQSLRVEFMATAASDARTIANVIATAAFSVIKDGWLAAPGVVFPDAVGMYFPHSTTPHVMWSEPFSYEQLSSVAISGIGEVHWLLAVPLADTEVEVLHTRGHDFLDALLGEHGVDHHDLYRDPVC